MKREKEINAQEPVEPEGAAGPEESNTPEVPPELKKKVQAYTAVIGKMLHGKKTRTDVFNMLESAPPEVSVPETSLTIHAQLEDSFKQRGEDPSLDVKLAGGVFLISELVEIGNAGGLWEISQEDGLASFLEPTMKQYIEKGLKDGTIDPVELQKAVEPLMNEEERGLGMQGMEAGGIPQEPGEVAAMESYANQKVRGVKKQYEAKSALGQAQAPQGQQGQGQPQGGM